jgi:hypothetical protein
MFENVGDCEWGGRGRALGVTPGFRKGKGMKARLGETAGGMWSTQY